MAGYFSSKDKRRYDGQGLAAGALSGAAPGAVSGITVNNDYQRQIRDQMAANSQAWHSAQSQREKDDLHIRNQALSQLLGSDVGFDGSSGRWSGSADADKGGSPGSYGAGSFSYEAAPSYVNRYQGQIDALTQKILGRGEFSYDPASDPLYQQYRETYTRDGRRAMQDTLGEVSARTGGWLLPTRGAWRSRLTTTIWGSLRTGFLSCGNWPTRCTRMRLPGSGRI